MFARTTLDLFAEKEVKSTKFIARAFACRRATIRVGGAILASFIGKRTKVAGVGAFALFVRDGAKVAGVGEFLWVGGTAHHAIWAIA